MKRKSVRHKSKQYTIKRILGESSTKIHNQSGKISLNLSETLESLPMTINQEELMIEAKLESNQLIVQIYCNEVVPSGGSLAGGEYETDEKDL